MALNNFIFVLVQFLMPVITLVSVIILTRTIRSNRDLNQRIIFNEVVKREMDVRLKLSEYREEIQKRLEKGKKREDWQEITWDSSTILFNYYEFLALCVSKKLIKESDAKIYFKSLLPSVRQRFEDSLLFVEGLAKKEDYPGLQWLFKRWEIEY